MKITEYTPSMEQGVKDLLVELQSCLAEIDPYRIIVLNENYRDGYFAYVLSCVGRFEGKIFVALEGETAVGALVCYLPPCGTESRLTTTCPRVGFISDLVVTASMRGKGIGSALLREAERHFLEKHCDFMQLNVFARNQQAIAFYRAHGMEEDCMYLKKMLPVQ